MPPVTKKLSKQKPKRELQPGDIIFIKGITVDGKRQQYTINGEPKDPHYFLVTSAEPGASENGHPFDLKCLHLGSIDKNNKARMRKKTNPYHNSNSILDNQNGVYYSDVRMPDSHRTSDFLVQVNKEFLFDSKALSYEHRGEMLSIDSFDDEYVDSVLTTDAEIIEFMETIDASILTQQQKIDKKKNLFIAAGDFKTHEENLPTCIRQKAQESKRMQELLGLSKKPKRTLTPEQETSVLLMKEHVDNEDKPKPTTTTTAPNPYNE